MIRSRTAARFLTGGAAVATALLVVWALLVPWAAAFPPRADHYKVSLFGVRHIADMTAESRQTSCHWGEPVSSCQPRAGGLRQYRALTFGRWIIMSALGLSLLGPAALLRKPTSRLTASILAATALSLLGGVALVRANVVGALAIFDGTQPVLPGPGMNAASLAAILSCTAAVASLMRRGAA